MNRFCRYELRTNNIDAARAFYANVFGPDFWGPDVTVGPMPERARAAGAPPHWLGHIGVADVEQLTARFLALGAERLGPTALRDPSGAVLALSREAKTRGRVAWHHLHATDREAAVSAYASLFGWATRELEDGHRTFAWDASGPSVGAISGTVRLPYVHPHWLFFFRVDDLEAALARAREGGAKALEPVATARGVLVALDDPQGGAFGIAQWQSGAC